MHSFPCSAVGVGTRTGGSCSLPVPRAVRKALFVEFSFSFIPQTNVFSLLLQEQGGGETWVTDQTVTLITVGIQSYRKCLLTRK